MHHSGSQGRDCNVTICAFVVFLPMSPSAAPSLQAPSLPNLVPHIFDLISSNSFCNSPLSASFVGQPMPNPSCSFGFGIKWKCT